MIDKLNADIEKINSTLDILPKKTKKNLEKYESYLDDSINKYKYLLQKTKEEINRRNEKVKSRYENYSFEEIDTSIDYDSIKLSDIRARSSEKLNLDNLFYALHHSNNNIDEVNKILTDIIKSFDSAGVVLTSEDFTLTKYVHEYIKALLTSKENIEDLFNDIYWKDSDILKHIELNFRTIYYKNENKLNDYFKNKFVNFEFSRFIHEHKNKIMAVEKNKHESERINYNLFVNGDFDVNEFLNEGRKSELMSSIFVNIDNSRNYENVVRLRKSLDEYKEFKRFEFIIKDFKSLYEHKTEYKDLLANKLKEIAKKEKTILGMNKKINKTGFFKPSAQKIIEIETEKYKLLEELIKDYEEIDSLKIKDTIFKYVNEETNYYDIFKLASYNFCYFVDLLKKSNAEITVAEIKDKLNELQKYIYDNYVDIIDNIRISENKELDKIVMDKYSLNEIKISPENLSLDSIDKFISNVDKCILYFDVDKLKLDLEGIKFMLDSSELIKKID